MKKVVLFLISLFIILPTCVLAKENNLVEVYVFYSSSCPHCKDAKAFLKEYESETKKIHINYYEVVHNKENALVLEKVQDYLDEYSMSVPYIVIGTEVFIGYSDSIKDDMINTITYYNESEYVDVVGKIIDGSIDKNTVSNYKNEYKNNSGEEVKVPILGHVNVKNVSIPLIAVVIGLVDGFNPCAMWVLIFLISMLINLKDHKKMWILGSAFILTSALVYALIMTAWLNIIGSYASVRWIQITISVVALIGAFLNFRSYYIERKKDNGCQIVSEGKRKKVISRIKKFTTEKSFILALIGVILLAISVNVVELACSAGLPVLFTNILALNNITGFKAFIYITIYILFFLLDDLIIFNIAAITFKKTGITTKYTKVSHLIGAIIMLVIGVLLIIKPEWIMFNF